MSLVSGVEWGAVIKDDLVEVTVRRRGEANSTGEEGTGRRAERTVFVGDLEGILEEYILRGFELFQIKDD